MKLTLRSKFILTTTGGMLLLCLILLLTSAIQSASQFRDIQKTESTRIAGSQADQVGQWYQAMVNTYRIYLRNESIANMKIEAAMSYLAPELAARKKDDPQLNTILLIDPSGIGHYPDNTTKNLAERAYFKEAMQGKEVLSEPLASASTGRPVVVIAYPVIKDGQTIGILAISVSLDYLINIVTKDSSTGTTHFIVAADGTIIAHPTPEYIMKKNVTSMDDDKTSGLNALGAEMIAGKAGSGDYVLEGVAKRLFFTPVPGLPWSFGYAETNEMVEQRVSSIIWNNVFSMVIALIIISALILPFIVLMTRKLKLFRRELDAITGQQHIKGDLTQRINVHGSDELGTMASFFNQFLGDLQDIMRVVQYQLGELHSHGQQLTENMEQTSAAVIQINSNISSIDSQMIEHGQQVQATSNAVHLIGTKVQELSRNVDSQTGAISQASVAIEEMVANLESITTNTDRLGEVVQSLTTISDNGKQQLNATLLTIKAVAEKSAGLESTNQMITDIAERTNMLAMNAAIEAAHAGESGKGFAVVAQEIRKLAELATQQSRTTSEILSSMRDAIESIVKNAANTEHAFADIMQAVALVTGLEEEVRASLMEQNSGSTQILQSLQHMRQTTDQVSRDSSEMLEQEQLVRGRMTTLTNIAGILEKGLQEIMQGTRGINESISNVDNLAQQNRQVILAVESATKLIKIEENA